MSTTIEDHNAAIADADGALSRASVAASTLQAAAEQATTAENNARLELASTSTLLTASQAEVAALLKRLKDAEQADPVVRLPFGIGIDEVPTTAAKPLPYTRAKLEQDAGAGFAYSRAYFTIGKSGAHAGAIAFVEACLKRKTVPIISFKLPAGDWTGAAAGTYDEPFDSTMDALQALVEKYRPTFKWARVIVAVHHEPNNGDGPKPVFDAMTRHLSAIIRRPGDVEFWVNLTGWAQLYGPANDWRLDDLVTDGIDGVAFDPYLSLGDSSTKLTDMASTYLVKFSEWAAERKVQWGIWETASNAKAATSTIAGVKTWWAKFTDACADLGATMAVWWNNKKDATSPNDWRVTSTKPADTHAQLVTSMRKWQWELAA